MEVMETSEQKIQSKMKMDKKKIEKQRGIKVCDRNWLNEMGFTKRKAK